MSKHGTNSNYSRKSLAVATAVLTLLGSMQLASASAAEPVPQEVWAFSSSMDKLTAVGDTLYFRANDGTAGTELWKHNSTTTTLVRDIRPGSSGSDPDKITAVGENVYFTADDGTPTGRELWKHNSTTTTLVRDIRVGSGDSNPNPRAAIGDTLYFTAYDGTETRLWYTNATTTTQVRDSGNATLEHSGSRPFKGMLFLNANNGTGERLWRAGGSPTSTASLVTPTNLSILQEPENFSVVGDYLYFSAVSAGVGRELWRTDGTDAGTELVRDLNTSGNGSPSQVVEFKGSLYFGAFDSNSLGLWKSDGSPTGTTARVVPEVGPEPIGPIQMKVAGDYLYFTASSNNVERQLWRTDGSNEGTLMLADFPGASNYLPSLLHEVGTNLFFEADDGEAGLEVWVSNGFEQGTRIVKNIKPGQDGSFPTGFTPVGNTMYFRAESPDVYKLWKSDGTEAGTQEIATTESIGNLTLVGSTIFFTSDNKLWRLSTASQSTGNNSSGGSFVTTPVVPTDSLKKVVRMKKVSDNKVSLPARAKRELRTNVRSMTSVTSAVCTGYVSNPRVASFTKKQARERAVRACNIVKRLQPVAEVRTRVVVVNDAKLPRLRSVRVVLTGR